MCGICGKLSSSGVQPEEIQTMLDTLVHRGPDDAGIYVEGGVGLGNRRLSVIDLLTGRQPISNEAGTIWIVYNGEIYNYQSLRRQLQEFGHNFRTNSDTEVILHLYEQFGEACVASLSGMFAFAIWDGRTEKLFLARDRIGQKPLYYARQGDDFLFASEPKAILAINSAGREMDWESVHHYLSLRFIPPPRTIFRGLNKLPPAHTLVYQHGQLSIQRYWQLAFTDKLGLTEDETLEALGEKLSLAVESHLVSDVPVGAFLSGGLDSSLIVSVLAKDLHRTPRTFSIGVEEGDFDELPYARMVSERYHTDHTEQRVVANLVSSLPHMIWYLDEPSDPIAACMFQAAQLASRHVKVVLGGDGGDELFAGFDRYVGNRYIDAYRYLPFGLRRGLIGSILARLPDSFTYKSLTQKLRWVHQLSLQSSPAEQYAAATSFFRFSHEDKRDLYAPDLWRRLGEIHSAQVITAAFNSDHAHHLLDRMLYTDYVTRLPEHSLMLTDRMTMAHGLEARSPFLDHQLVEFLARLPAGIKVRNGRTKYLMRKLAAAYLPDSIVQRQKQGFMFPIAYWFRTDLYPFLHRTLPDSFFVRQGFFSREYIKRLLREHRDGRFDHHVRLWMLINLEIWHQLYIEQQDLLAVAERIVV